MPKVKREYRELTKPKLIVCEGPSDISFFRAIIKKFDLPEVCIRYTSKDGSGPGGIDKFGSFLSGVRLFQGFDDITDILLVADNDLSPEENFRKIQTQITSVPDNVIPPVQYTAPSEPLHKAGRNPSLTVMMIPRTGQAGTLETLCLDAALDASPDIAKAVESFAVESGADRWHEVTLKGKMKLRSVMAAAHKSNPCITLKSLFEQNPDLIPMEHQCFKHVVDFMKSFCTS